MGVNDWSPKPPDCGGWYLGDCLTYEPPGIDLTKDGACDLTPISLCVFDARNGQILLGSCQQCLGKRYSLSAPQLVGRKSSLLQRRLEPPASEVGVGIKVELLTVGPEMGHPVSVIHTGLPAETATVAS